MNRRSGADKPFSQFQTLETEEWGQFHFTRQRLDLHVHAAPRQMLSHPPAEFFQLVVLESKRVRPRVAVTLTYP